MTHFGLVAACSVLLLLGGGPAAAQGFSIKPQAPQSAFGPSLKPDVVGIDPTMSGQQVVALADQHFKGRTKPGVANAKFPQTNIVFPVSIYALDPVNWSNKNGEELRVYFTGPASGNKTWFIFRRLMFSDNQRPAYDATVTALLSKYGSPTTAVGGTLLYAYKDGKLLSGARTYDLGAIESVRGTSMFDSKDSQAVSSSVDLVGCRNADGSLNPRNAAVSLPAFFNQYQNLNCDAVLRIQLSTDSDKTRVRTMEMRILDIKGAVSAALIDNNALIAAKEFGVKSTPTAAPPRL